MERGIQGLRPRDDGGPAGGAQRRGHKRPASSAAGNAFTIMALDPAVFVGEEHFRADAAALVAWVKSLRLAPGFGEINVPGELERRERQRRRRAFRYRLETGGDSGGGGAAGRATLSSLRRLSHRVRRYQGCQCADCRAHARTATCVSVGEADVDA